MESIKMCPRRDLVVTGTDERLLGTPDPSDGRKRRRHRFYRVVSDQWVETGVTEDGSDPALRFV